MQKMMINDPDANLVEILVIFVKFGQNFVKFSQNFVKFCKFCRNVVKFKQKNVKFGQNFDIFLAKSSFRST